MISALLCLAPNCTPREILRQLTRDLILPRDTESARGLVLQALAVHLYHVYI